jgi:hypothetical protein
MTKSICSESASDPKPYQYNLCYCLTVGPSIEYVGVVFHIFEPTAQCIMLTIPTG